MRAILTYHSIDDSGSAVSVSAAQFRAHARWLGSGAVDVVPLARLLEGRDQNAIAITFDDGFANFATAAWPALRDHGLPATLYVVSDHAGGTNAWGGRDAPGIPTLPLLGWQELGRLAEEGVELGAHTRRHPDLRLLSDSELADEMDGCSERIRRETGRRPSSFAYPYGAVDGRVDRAAAERFANAVTTEFRTLKTVEHPFHLPRLDAYYLREAGRLESWGRAAFRRWIWLRGLLRRARAAFSPTVRPAA
jgi:peptidoglycan/xylan/chitin deacetylase (PgdA/CDA1 family)